MDTDDVDPISFPVSASPEVVTHILNKSGELEKKTRGVVIYFDKGVFDVYRESSGGPDVLSREQYNLSTMKMVYKDSLKFPPRIKFPKELTHSVRIRGIEFSAFAEIDLEIVDKIITGLKLDVINKTGSHLEKIAPAKMEEVSGDV